MLRLCEELGWVDESSMREAPAADLAACFHSAQERQQIPRGPVADHLRNLLVLRACGAESKLVERFRLLKNGQVLSVLSTWTDAKVFRAPHSYEYRYNRMTRDYEGRLGSGCDPYDDERTAFLTGTP